MNIHMNRIAETEVEGEIDIEKMRRYILYAKSSAAPSLAGY